jgi:molecular chaperone DnaK
MSAAPPISGPPTVYGANAPVSGGAPVTFSRGAAAIPGTANPLIPHPPIPPRPTGAAPATTPAFGGSGGNGAPGVPVNGATAIPWPPPPLPAAPGGDRRGLVKFLAIGALAVALLAAGTTGALILLNKKDKTNAATPPTTTTAPVASAPANPAQAFPTDKMLIRVDTGGDAPPDRQSRIYYFTPGSATRTPLPNSQAGDVLPKWSHSRKQIAVTHSSPDGKSSSIYVMNADGSHRHRVTANGGGRVAWSADDQKLAFMRNIGGVNQIVVLTLADGHIRQLTHSSTLKDDAMWSPDGKTILYWLNKGGIKQLYELQVANPQEPGRQITGPDVGPANDPVYSPDGQQILFTRELDGGATSDIWMVNRNGSDPHQVTSNQAREMDPTWSPDGKWFAFVRGDFNRPTVVIERADGSNEVPLTKPGAREGHPCWF